MSEEEGEPLDVRRVMSVLIVLLVLAAALMFIIGELLVAGVMMLSLTFAIYLRETW